VIWPIRPSLAWTAVPLLRQSVFGPVTQITFINWQVAEVRTFNTKTLLSHSMQQNPSWEANWFSASQEIPHISWNPKVHYRMHESFLCEHFVTRYSFTVRRC
jgi:hypothetical protein